MDKNRVCYLLRKNYPKAFGIRRTLQRIKVDRVQRHLLPDAYIEPCEKDPSRKKDTIRPYLEKWAGYLRPTVAEMEIVLAKAPRYQDRADLDEVRTDILFCRLAYGFIPSEYVGFSLENRLPEERKAFVSDVDTNVFGYSVNDISQVQSFLDKAEGYKRVKDHFRRDAVVVEKAKDYPAFASFAEKHPVFVKKAVFSSMGKGVELVEWSEQASSPRDYFDRLIRQGKFLLEERVIQSDVLAQMNASSVNTVRCMTFSTREGIVVPYCFFKAGRNGSFVDNAGLGGIVVGVQPETGICFTDGFTEYGERFIAHPETGIPFKGFAMPDWKGLIEQCTDIARQFPDMRYLSFDMAHTDQGWVVIEVNEVGQFIIPQTVMQRGIRQELWDWLDRMEKCI